MITIRHYMTDGRYVDEDTSTLDPGTTVDQIQDGLEDVMINKGTGQLHTLIRVIDSEGRRHLINTANLVRTTVVGTTDEELRSEAEAHLRLVRDRHPGPISRVPVGGTAGAGPRDPAGHGPHRPRRWPE
jgi:hypothetical protein